MKKTLLLVRFIPDEKDEELYKVIDYLTSQCPTCISIDSADIEDEEYTALVKQVCVVEEQ